MAKAEWVDRMRDTSVFHLASQLGLAVREGRGGTSPGSFECPLCEAETRHSTRGDRRGAAGIRPDDRGWACFTCDSRGDAIDLVAAVVTRKRFNDGNDDERRAVSKRCKGLLGMTDDSKELKPPPSPPPRESVKPIYPPEEDYANLWKSLGRVDQDGEVAGWLASKRIDAAKVADRDLARELPGWAKTPEWASLWNRGGHRLIVPMVDSHGVCRSFAARRMRDGDGQKSLAPKGHSRKGLVFACGLARQILSVAGLPDWWPRNRQLHIIIVEGEKKFLQCCTNIGDADECAPAVIGIESGSIGPDLIGRLPKECALDVFTDRDEAGARYATVLLRELARRDDGPRVFLRNEFAVDATPQGLTVKVAP